MQLQLQLELQALDAKETINILMSTFLQTTDSRAATNCLETETKSKHAREKLFAIQVVGKRSVAGGTGFVRPIMGELINMASGGN